MTWYNWLIAIIPFSLVLYMAFHTRKYIRGIPDFLAGGRLCGRYLLSVGGMEASLSVMWLIAYIEIHYRTGFSTGFWANISIFWSISTSKDARPTPKKIFDKLLRELECHLDFILCFCTDACSGTAPETCSYIS